jgi:hypothetical protein
MIAISGIPRDTLVSYRNGRRTPPPDKMDALYTAAAQLGGSVELFRTPQKNGVQVVATSIPELDRSISWEGRASWLNATRPHLTNDARFDMDSVPSEAIKWLDLSGVLLKMPPRITIAVFPRASYEKSGSHWVHAIADFERVQSRISGEFVIARLCADRIVGSDRSGKPKTVTPSDAVLCQQVRFAPRSGSQRQLRVVPAWSWPTCEEEKDRCFDFQPWCTELSSVKPLYHGNLRIVQTALSPTSDA